MKKDLISVALILCCLQMFAQDSLTTELKILTDSNQYKKITEYALKPNEYSAKSLFYIGQAFFMIADDQNSIKYSDLSIKKDPNDPAPYFIKGSTLNYMQKYNDAIKAFKTAITLNPKDAKLYSGLGDSYYNSEKYELAIGAYTKSCEVDNPSDRSFYMIGQIYSELNDNKKALEAFHLAKAKISKESEYYINTLFNIGLLESLAGNYDSAEPVFLELIQLNPNDFHTYAKLIQIYYHRKEYDKAIPFKEKLYDAHKKGLLKDNLEDMFCFDQFKLGDRLIQAFERFEEGDKKDIYNKHLFYVVNQKGDIEFRVQTEYSPVSIELGGPKYILCANKGEVHFNSGVGFNDNFNYEDLKQAVIKMVEAHIK